MTAHLVIRAMVPLKALVVTNSVRVSTAQASLMGPTMALQAAKDTAVLEALVKTQATEVPATTCKVEVSPETTTKANRVGAANPLPNTAAMRASLQKATNARMNA